MTDAWDYAFVKSCDIYSYFFDQAYQRLYLLDFPKNQLLF